jgi:hypothetical protein
METRSPDGAFSTGGLGSSTCTLSTLRNTSSGSVDSRFARSRNAAHTEEWRMADSVVTAGRLVPTTVVRAGMSWAAVAPAKSP